jgi:hypothetical protein
MGQSVAEKLDTGQCTNMNSQVLLILQSDMQL